MFEVEEEGEGEDVGRITQLSNAKRKEGAPASGKLARLVGLA